MGTSTSAEKTATTEKLILSAEMMHEHWQGHRRLTRRVIEAFPDDKLFTYSVGGMRPMAELAMEMIRLAMSGIRGMATGEWLSMKEIPHHSKTLRPTNKAELLELWDEVTELIDELWPTISLERFNENDSAFGQYEGPVYSFLLYWIDNENHHRGQAYVYLRSLGIGPPHFWER